MFDWWDALDILDWFGNWRFWLCLLVSALMIFLIYTRLPETTMRLVFCGLAGLAGLIVFLIWESGSSDRQR